MIYLFNIYYVVMTIDLITATLSVVIDRLWPDVIIAGVQLLLGKIPQIFVMWKMFSARVGSKLKFTTSVIAYIIIMMCQILLVFIRIIVYLLDESNAQQAACTVMAWIDMVITIGLAPLLHYCLMQFIHTFAIKPEE